MDVKRHPAYWTDSAGANDPDGKDLPMEHSYDFAPLARSSPIRSQRNVQAIIDIAKDGTLVGVEPIDDMPPPPEDKRL